MRWNSSFTIKSSLGALHVCCCLREAGVHPCTFVGAPEVGHIAHSGKVDASYVVF